VSQPGQLDTTEPIWGVRRVKSVSVPSSADSHFLDSYCDPDLLPDFITTIAHRKTAAFTPSVDGPSVSGTQQSRQYV